MSFDQEAAEQANISGADLALMVDEMAAMRAEIEKCSAALPGMHYMDIPDGGDVPVSEQVRRMAEDAARYRWLMNRLQASYDGEAFENDEPTIYCHMTFGRKEVSRMQAEISWFDVRGEPLNLSAAIDQALTKEQAT